MLARAVMLSGIYAVGNVLQRAVSVVLVPLYTAWLNPQDFGVIAMLQLSGLLIGRTIETPVVSALNRFYYRPGYREQNDVLTFNLFAVAAVLLGVVSCLYWLAAPALAGILLDDAGPTSLVRLYTSVLVLATVSTLLGLLVQLNELPRTYLTASFANVFVSAGVAVTLLAGYGLGVRAMIFGQAAGHAVFAAVCLPVLLRKVRWRLRPGMVRQPLRFGYATLLSGYANLLMQTGDRFALRGLLTVADVGLYAFAGNFAQLVTLVFCGPAISGTGPAIRKLEANRDEQRAFIRRITTWVWIVGLWVVLALAAFSHEVVAALASKPEFVAAWTVIPIMAFSRLLHAMAGFTNCGITQGDRPGWMSLLVVAAAVINLGLNLLLIPHFGLMGAAAATCTSYLLWNAANAALSWRFYRLSFDWRRMAHALIPAVGLFAVAQSGGSSLSLWAGVLLKCSLVAAYPLVLALTGLMTADERDAVRRRWGRIREQHLSGGLRAGLRAAISE